MEKNISSSVLKNDRLRMRIQERETWFANRGEKLRLIRAIENYQHPRRRLLVNILALASFAVGLSVGTVLVITLIVMILNTFISLPIIGQSINELLEWVERFKSVRA
ncbi:DUF5665 domain-containing protein [Aneurinibacillus sp. REN35]|uniref:DUF5665 domain-containing protein n=1 Tax=Aneurinibacillus sp. REN35 TaxID=3237286 RepID=UPI0035293141